MFIKKLIRNKIHEFEHLCVEHKVGKLYTFGSAASENFNPESSDIDVLVEIEIKDPLERGETLIDFWNKLEDFFERKVDLLTESSIRNPILKNNIENTKVLIYDGTGNKVLD